MSSSAIEKPRSGWPRSQERLTRSTSRRCSTVSSRARSDARRVPGLAQARDRLAHLADRPALEREARGVHDRLVADVDRAQADRVPVGEVRARDAQRGDAPGVGVAVAREVGEQRRRGRRVADGIAGDERHAADRAVGEEGRALLVEEVRLVAPQREVGERVAAVALDEPPRVAAVGDGCADGASRAAAARARRRRRRR